MVNICLLLFIENLNLKDLDATIKSSLKYINYYIIGANKDLKFNELEQKLEEYKIPRKIIYFDLFNEDYNKEKKLNELLLEVYKVSNYCLFLNSGEIIYNDFDVTNLIKDGYYLKFLRKNKTSYKLRLIKNNVDLFKFNSFFDYFYSDKSFSSEKIDLDYYIRQDKQLITNFNEIVFEKYNALNILEIIDHLIDNDLYEKAKEILNKLLNINCEKEYLFYIYYKFGEISEKQNFDWIESENHYLKSFKFFSFRCESLIKIISHYRLSNNFEKSLFYANLFIENQNLNKCYILIENNLYEYKIYDEMLISYYYSNKFRMSYKCGKELLKRNIPEWDLNRVKKNIKFSLNNNIQKQICAINVINYSKEYKKIIDKLVDNLGDIYEIIIFGNINFENNKLLQLNENDFIDYFIKNNEIIELLIMFNNINFLIYHQEYCSKIDNVILLQLDENINIITNMQTKILCNDQQVFNNIFNKFVKIIFIDEKNFHYFKNKIYFKKKNLYYINFNNFWFKFLTLLEKPNHESNYVDKLTYILDKITIFHPIYFLKLMDKYNDNKFKKIIDNYILELDDDLFLKERFEKDQNLFELFLDIDKNRSDFYRGKAIEKLSISKGKDKILDNNLFLLKLIKYFENENYESTLKYFKKIDNNILSKQNNKFYENIKLSLTDQIQNLYTEYNQICKNICKQDSENNIRMNIYILCYNGINNLEKTINSFINCCNDFSKINDWFLLDFYCLNNSDIIKINDDYPFINVIKQKPENLLIYRKNYLEIIKNNLNDSEYLIILNDNIKFIETNNYIEKCLNFLENDEIGLLFLNKTKKLKQYELDYEEFFSIKKQFDKNNKYCLDNFVWPGILYKCVCIKTSILKNMNFQYDNKYFEFHIIDYIIDKKYKMICLPNKNYIYDLNITFELLFNEIFSLNLIIDGSNQTLENVDIKCNKFFLDQKKVILNDQIIDKFKNNNFGYNKKIINEILIHKKIWESHYFSIIISNKIIYEKNFYEKILNIFKKYYNEEFDILNLCKDNIENAYMIKKSGSKKILNFYNKIRITDGLENILYQCPNLIIYEINESFVAKYAKRINQINKIDNYIFFSNMESQGYDLKYVGKKNLETLVKISNEDPLCLGFNTLGWLKFKITKPDKFKDFPIENNKLSGLYIKNIKFIVKNKVNFLLNRKKSELSDLIFTVTTCKRWKYFKHTMTKFLIFCKDIELIDKWVCIDDNSSEEERIKMKKKFPFFEFIFKNIEEKGHAKSMNILWDKIDSTYIFHFEDDWECNYPFYVKSFLDFVKQKKLEQLIFRKISRGKDEIFDVIGNRKIFKYKYNPNHPIKPQVNKQYDQENDYFFEENNDGWWWPGFTLNPSIINIKLFKENIGYFNEKIKQELFEYDYALRSLNKKLNTYYVDLGIEHFGNITSYALNDLKRYYDK